MEEKLYAAYVKARNEYWAVFDRLAQDHHSITNSTDYQQAVENCQEAYNAWLAVARAGKENDMK